MGKKKVVNKAIARVISHKRYSWVAIYYFVKKEKWLIF